MSGFIEKYKKEIEQGLTDICNYYKRTGMTNKSLHPCWVNGGTEFGPKREGKAHMKFESTQRSFDDNLCFSFPIEDKYIHTEVWDDFRDFRNEFVATNFPEVGSRYH